MPIPVQLSLNRHTWVIVHRHRRQSSSRPIDFDNRLTNIGSGTMNGGGSARCHYFSPFYTTQFILPSIAQEQKRRLSTSPLVLGPDGPTEPT
jgi:hypothetical protein